MAEQRNNDWASKWWTRNWRIQDAGVRSVRKKPIISKMMPVAGFVSIQTTEVVIDLRTHGHYLNCTFRAHHLRVN